MPWGLAIGAIVGLAKNQLSDVPREKKQRALAAATQQYSPWTGLQAQPIQQADPFGNALQFGAAGAGIGSGIKNSNAWSQLLMGLGKNLQQDSNPQEPAKLQLPELGSSAGYAPMSQGYVSKPAGTSWANPGPFSNPAFFAPSN